MKKLFKFFYRDLFIFLIIVFIGFPSSASTDSSMNDSYSDSDQKIVELINVKVPYSLRTNWLKVEKDTWGQWLKNQKGFISRELFWDKNNQEGIVLITWANRKQWKSISKDELDDLQELFEVQSRLLTGQKSGNPFPLNFVVELLPQ